MRKIVAYYSGFTLIELAVVLTIIALITGMGVSMGLDVLETSKRSATESRMNEIEDALLKFRKVNDRLPCPGSATLATTDTNYGVEAANLGTCTLGTPAATNTTVAVGSTPAGVPSGSVPTKTLGLPLDYMYDGWGRKFQYEVVADLTAAGSFSQSHPSDICVDNGITIYDENYNAAGTITTGAVYALNSFGKNGIGAYTKAGTRFTTGTVGTHEAVANRSTTNIPRYIYKSGVRGDINTIGYYDDILRYKLRSQLVSDEEQNKKLYRGPEAFLLRTGSATGQFNAPKMVCNRLSTSASSVYTDVFNNYQYAAFTPNNSHLFITSSDSTYCYLYQLFPTGMVSVPTGMTCSASMTVYGMAGGTGRLARTTSLTPFVQLWNFIGGAYKEITSPISPPPTTASDHISFSDDAVFMTLSGTSYTYLYKWDGSQYKRMVGDASVVDSIFHTTYSTVENNAISPNGQFYVAAVGSSPAVIHLWRNVNGTFVKSTDTESLTDVVADKITFSTDSKYIAIASSGTIKLAIVKINDVADSLSAMTISGAQPAGTPAMVSFNRDASYLLVANSTTLTAPYDLYKRTDSSTYTKQTFPATISVGTGTASTVAVFAR